MDIAEWEVGDSCMGQMFVKIIICNNLEGRPQRPISLWLQGKVVGISWIPMCVGYSFLL